MLKNKISFFESSSYLFVVLFVVLFFDIILSKFSFFITEGWFEAYANQINQGIDIYKNYEYLLPPLTVMIFSKAISLFETEFLSIRYLFVAIHILNVFVIYIFLRRFTDSFLQL